MTRATPVDRPAAVRRAMRQLVAERGFHGTSMSAVAKRAGVATGTAYVHYQSKDQLVLATYVEVKQELGRAATSGLDTGASPRSRFAHLWRAAHCHLVAEPERAGFLVQADASPFGHQAHELGMISDDPIMAEAVRPDMAALLRPLPLALLFDLGFGPLVRAVAGGIGLCESELEHLIEGSWRAITIVR